MESWAHKAERTIERSVPAMPLWPGSTGMCPYFVWRAPGIDNFKWSLSRGLMHSDSRYVFLKVSFLF